jgi:serine/threonine protein kinase
MRGGSQGAKQHLRARHLRSLEHKNVIGLLGICTDSQHMGLFMEYADQGTLREFLHNPSLLSMRDRQNMIVDFCCGLHVLHSAQPTPMLHGDIKSSNVLVMADGTCKFQTSA